MSYSRGTLCIDDIRIRHAAVLGGNLLPSGLDAVKKIETL